MTLTELGIIIEKELKYDRITAGKWSANFHRVEVRQDNGLLVSVFGQGENEEKARRDYAKRLAGQRIVIDAYLPSVREFPLPITLKN
ncbi:MAG: hypothetical protein M0R03_20695 [Novosphingobium sp.]|jgi:hypothetical protein|nr:hypothetical protein [Novosphingobium sp.]